MNERPSLPIDQLLQQEQRYQRILGIWESVLPDKLTPVPNASLLQRLKLAVATRKVQHSRERITGALSKITLQINLEAKAQASAFDRETKAIDRHLQTLRDEGDDNTSQWEEESRQYLAQRRSNPLISRGLRILEQEKQPSSPPVTEPARPAEVAKSPAEPASESTEEELSFFPAGFDLDKIPFTPTKKKYFEVLVELPKDTINQRAWIRLVWPNETGRSDSELSNRFFSGITSFSPTLNRAGFTLLNLTPSANEEPVYRLIPIKELDNYDLMPGSKIPRLSGNVDLPNGEKVALGGSRQLAAYNHLLSISNTTREKLFKNVYPDEAIGEELTLTQKAKLRSIITHLQDRIRTAGCVLVIKDSGDSLDVEFIDVRKPKPENPRVRPLPPVVDIEIPTPDDHSLAINLMRQIDELTQAGYSLHPVTTEHTLRQHAMLTEPNFHLPETTQKRVNGTASKEIPDPEQLKKIQDENSALKMIVELMEINPKFITPQSLLDKLKPTQIETTSDGREKEHYPSIRQLTSLIKNATNRWFKEESDSSLKKQWTKEDRALFSKLNGLVKVIGSGELIKFLYRINIRLNAVANRLKSESHGIIDLKEGVKIV